MARTFYTDFVNHCLKFYARYPYPTFKNDVDKKNWKACHNVLRNLPDQERNIILYIFSSGDTTADMMYEISNKEHINQDYLYKMLANVQYKIAKKRGLI